MVKAEIFGPNTYDTCENRVKTLTGILLIFHPGCGHCVQMRPEWEEMKRRLSPDTKVVEIDGSEMSGHSSMNSSPVIQRTRGFPSIFRLKNGKVIGEYQGPRTAEEMRKFSDKKMKKKASEKVKKAKSKSKKQTGKSRRRKLTKKD
jgi:thioredoxin-like negative regulator of GroEL